MSESVSREQRRNLRKAIGETATAAMEETRQLAYHVNVAQQALAKELLQLQGTWPGELKKLHARVDGTSQWCQQNEELIKRRDRQHQDLVDLVRQLQEEVRHLRRRLFVMQTLTFVERVKWALFGIVPLDLPPVHPDTEAIPTLATAVTAGQEEA